MEALRLLRRAYQAGLAVTLTGDQVVVRGPKRAASLVRLLAVHKGKIIVALTDATSWSARYQEALSHWGSMQNRWHRLYGGRGPDWQCAGCGEPIGGGKALLLGDGNRVHLDDPHGLACVIAWGSCWRAAATRGLIANGLRPPPETDVL